MSFVPRERQEKPGCGSVWLERYIRDVEAASSNLVTPINKRGVPLGMPLLFIAFDKI